MSVLKLTFFDRDSVLNIGKQNHIPCLRFWPEIGGLIPLGNVLITGVLILKFFNQIKVS